MSRTGKIGRLEGDGASRLTQLMRIHGYNPGMVFEPGTVLQTNPLKIQLHSDKLILDEEDFAINEDLLSYSETVKIDGESHTIEYPLQIKSGDMVLVANNADEGQYFYVMCKLISF
jgi:hypothetical protein